MSVNSCRKMQIWTRRDTFRSTLIFFINVVICTLLFLLTVYLNCRGVEGAFLEYFNHYEKILQFVAFLILTCGVVGLFLFFDDRDFLKSSANIELMFLVVELTIIIAYALAEYVNVYLIPFALPSLLIMFLFDKRKGLIVNVLFTGVIVLFIRYSQTVLDVSNVLFIAGFIASMLAIITMDKVYSRFVLFVRSFVMSFPIAVFYALRLINSGEPIVVMDIVCAVMTGVATTLVFVLLLPFFEGLFKKNSCFRLAEMTNHNNRLIKRLIVNAPGTFHHSIAVSNLAEACAIAVGEDALFTRVCAYYHDIGKIRRPEFFKENQRDNRNPHDDLTPELSANIIRSHTQDGYDLLIKNRFPKEIADICLQHHGTMPITFFYDKAKKFTDGEVDINKYSYQGPKPQSKVAAIIMIVDGCEAVVRTLSDRSYENIYKEIKKIVQTRMDYGQFDECEITSNDLSIITDVLTASFTSVYHDRILYPEQVEEAKRQRKKKKNA